MSYFSIRKDRLQQLQKLRPQYAEIYDFYQNLYAFLEKEEAHWFTCEPDLQNWEPRCQAGFPMINGDALGIDEGEARVFLGRLVQELALHGREGHEELLALEQALEKGELSIGTLLRACIDRDRMAVALASEQIGIQPAVLEFVLSTALAYALQRWLAGSFKASTEGWQQGYCPVCGGVPVMAELAGEEGKKVLHCPNCLTKWETTRLQCSYCGNDDTGSLEYFTAEGEPGYRVNLCRKCSCYLKVVDTRELGEGLPMDVEDFTTVHLDMLAQQEGFTRGKRQTVS